MPPLAAQTHSPAHIRAAVADDISALLLIERDTFDTDHISRRSLRAFVSSPRAALMVAEKASRIVGYILVLFRAGTAVARLYSVAVVPELVGRGIATLLLNAAEKAALKRNCSVMRLEVQDSNIAAITRYQKLGYRQFARRDHYYENGGAALRFEKPLYT